MQINPVVKKNIIFYFLTDISGFISVSTTFFTMTWLTFQLTGSPSSLGLVGFAQNIPFLLFSIYGGVLADKYDRKKIVVKCIIGLVLLSFITIILVWLNVLTYPIILILSFLLGSIIAINFPSMIGLVKDIVPDKKLFPRVMGAASSNAKIGQIISSSTFTIIFSLLSAIGTFFFALAGNLIALFSIILIKKAPQETNLNGDSTITQLVSGLKYVLKYKPLLAVTITSTMISIVFAYVIYQMPIIDSGFLKGGSAYLGILYFAGAIGGISSGIYMAKRKSTKNILKFFVLCAFICGVSAIGLSLSRVLWLDFIFAIGIDFSLIAAIGISNTVLQILTEVSMRGRVLGVYLSFNWGITAIVIMLLGFLADSMGTEHVLIIIGAAAILAGIIYFLSIKKQRPMLDEMYKERDVDEGHELI